MFWNNCYTFSMTRTGWYPHKGWPDRPRLSPAKHPQLHSGSTAWVSQVRRTSDSVRSHDCHGITHPPPCLSPLPLWPREDISREANISSSTSSTNPGRAALKPHACPMLLILQRKVTREFTKIIETALRIEAGTVEASNPHPFCVVVVIAYWPQDHCHLRAWWPMPLFPALRRQGKSLSYKPAKVM